MKSNNYCLTINDLILYLQQFNPNTKLCYMNFIEGVKYECEYIKMSDLGKHLFYYVNKLHSEFQFVNQNDVVIL